MRMFVLLTPNKPILWCWKVCLSQGLFWFVLCGGKIQVGQKIRLLHRHFLQVVPLVLPAYQQKIKFVVEGGSGFRGSSCEAVFSERAALLGERGNDPRGRNAVVG